MEIVNVIGLLAWWIYFSPKGVCGLKIDHRGRHFVLAFPDSGTDDNTNLLVITSQSDVTVYVIIPEDSHMKYTISAGSSEHIYLPFNTTVVSNMTVERKGIQIIASDAVSVYGYVNQHDSIGGFLVLPVEALSTDYIAVTYYPHNKKGGHLVVVAAESNTDIEIVMKTSVFTTCNDKQVPDNHLFTVTLQALEVVRIFCDQDITGTLVKSNKPVAVLSGNPLTQVPRNVMFPDNLVEMMIPTYALGRHYVLPSDYGRTCGTIFRVVGLKDHTEVVESDGKAHGLAEREFIDLTYEHNQFRCIKSNNPVLVVQFGKGESADAATFAGDPFMIVIPPVERYAPIYDLDLYSAATTPGHAVVTNVTTSVNKSKVNGFDFMTAIFEEIPGCDMVIASKTVGQGHMKLGHRDGGTFGAIVHGFTSWKAYGYMAGMLLDDYSGENECASSPCQGKGLCYEVGRTYRCYCHRKAQGAQCGNELPLPTTSGRPTDETIPMVEVTTVEEIITPDLDLKETSPVISTEPKTPQIQTSDMTSTEHPSTEMPDSQQLTTEVVKVSTPPTEADTTDADVTAMDFKFTTGVKATTEVKSTPKVEVTTEPEVTAPEVKPQSLRSMKSNPCNCTCKNITYQEVEEKAREIKKELTVNPVVLSKSKRKFVSVQDDRLSASSIGYLGGAFLTLVFGSIFLVDLSTVISRWWSSMRDKTRAHEAALRSTSVRRKQVLHVRPEAIVLHVTTDQPDL